MNKIFLRILALVLSLVTVCGCFSGCSKTVKDAELRLPLSAEPDTLDPQIAATRESRTVVLNCFEGLMKLT
ncbi:MAG: peptide ABC transporter substrate-binding protein, partial [Clostridia bacterium]|nr:peptide ABC transporter substrate-binding protein [Clostridia bacterium]